MSLDKLIGSQLTDNNRKGVGYNAVPPPPTCLFAPPTIDLSSSGVKEFKQPEFKGYGVKVNKSACENSSTKIKKTLDALIIEDWVSNIDEDEFEEIGDPQVALKDTRNFNSGCSRHMIRNKSYLTDYQDHDGGFVAFAGSSKGGRITGKDSRKDNCCFDLKNIVPSKGLTCLIAKATNDESKLWHRRLGHLNFKTLNKLVKGNLVRGLPPKTFENDHTCVACQKGKQHKATCKSNLVNTISQPLQILHMDLFGPTFVKSIMGKMYCLVITDDYSRFSWVFFLAKKGETSGILKNFITGIENQLNHKVKVIRCDNRTEFKNYEMNQFCGIKGIKREFSNVRTPQQNRVAERKNRTLIEAARTMLADSLLPIPFWAEVVNTACYVQNMVLVTKPHSKTPYELLLGRTPTLSFMRPLGCPVTILNTLNHLGKFDGKADEGVLVGYSINSKAFRVYNHRTRIVEENLHVNFLENKSNIAGNRPEWLFDIDSLTNTMNYQPVSTKNRTNGNAGIDSYVPLSPEEDVSSLNDDAVNKKTEQDSAIKEAQILMNDVNQEKEATKHSDDAKNQFEEVCDKYLFEGLDTRTSSTNSFNTTNNPICTTSASRGPPLVSFDGSLPVDVHTYPDDPLMPNLEDTVEPQGTSIFGRAYDDDDFYNSPFDDKNMGAEADFNNMEPSIVVNEPKNITRALEDESWVEAMQEELLQFKLLNVWTLVDLAAGKKAIGHRQEEGIDYDEVFAHVARIEVIRLFLAYASYMNFTVYQMDVKSAFLYGTIEEEIYAPRAWYETLLNYLLENGFRSGSIDKTLFIKKIKNDILLVQVYVDDIIFGSTKKSLSTKFEQLMHKRLQMSSMGELTFFLGLQVEQRKDGIFLSQDKYVYDILKKFGFSSVKTASTPMETHKSLATSVAEPDVDVHLYRFQVTPKTSHMHAVKRIFRYLKGQPSLGLWYPKDSPLDLIAYSDSDYASASIDRKTTTGGCQFLGCRLISRQCKKQTIVANSTTKAEYIAASNCCGQSTISVIKNPVAHSKTKHIEIRFHFIRDSYEKRLIEMVKIHTDYNVTDLLTKAFDVTRFQFLIASIAGSEEFHEIVDFLAGSHIRYALTTNPTIYVSLVEQFWQTATVETINDGEPHITVTVDEHNFAITEASVRRHLQLADVDGGYTPRSVEGSIKLNELTNLCTKLVDRVTSLETELTKTKHVYGKTIIKLVKKVKHLEDKLKSTKVRRKARIVLSEEEEELVSETLQQQELTPLKDQSVQDQSISSYKVDLSLLSAAKILAEASTEKIKTYKKRRTSTDEEIARKLHEEEQANSMELQEQERLNLEAAKVLQRRLDQRQESEDIDWSKIVEQVQERQSGSMIRYQTLKKKPATVAQANKNMKIYLKNIARYMMFNFKGMTYDQIRPIFEKEYNKESFKKLRIVQASSSEPVQEPSTSEPNEPSEEDLNKMMEIIPVEEFKPEVLQTKYPIMDWEIHTEGSRKEDLDTLWKLVKEKFSSAEPVEDMEKVLWIELKRLYEPDKDDILWKLQRYMHDPLTWKLYESCGVHHVSSTRGHDIFMLIEKDYSLTTAVIGLMLSRSLQVEEYSEMARDLIRKIFREANKPRS
ncbi:putative ribonuclease H-like domain-containing protein [Tanacetum coccineum]